MFAKEIREMRAFPSSEAEGMTLRDFFAAKALVGLLIANNVMRDNKFAEAAYKMADDMLKERKKNE